MAVAIAIRDNAAYDSSSTGQKWNDYSEVLNLIQERKFSKVVLLIARHLQDENLPPYDKILWSTLKIYCLIRRHQFREASEEVAALGRLDRPLYCFETYPEIYGTVCGSMIPFSLRLLSSCVPMFLGATTSAMDRLYSLYRWTFKQVNLSTCPAVQYLWTSRLILTAHLVAELHVSLDQHEDALALLSEVLIRQPQHVDTMALMGRIFLTMGATESAEEQFSLVECLSKGSNATTEMNNGLLACSKCDYRSARLHFENSLNLYKGGSEYPNVAAGKVQPPSIGSDTRSTTTSTTSRTSSFLSTHPKPSWTKTNNLAVACLYDSNLYDATMCLENLLMKNPTEGAFMTAVKNLVIFYEFSPNKMQCVDYLEQTMINEQHGVREDPEIGLGLTKTD